MKYNEEIMKANPYDIFVPIEKGTTKRQHKALDEFPAMERVNRKIDRLDLRDKSEDVILKMTLKAFGVEENQNVTSMYLLCSMLLQGKWLFDDEEYYTIGSTNGYISNGMEIKNVLKKKYVDNFKDLFDGFHQFVNSEIVVDEEKKEKYLDTLQGG